MPSVVEKYFSGLVLGLTPGEPAALVAVRQTREEEFNKKLHRQQQVRRYTVVGVKAWPRTDLINVLDEVAEVLAVDAIKGSRLALRATAPVVRMVEARQLPAVVRPVAVRDGAATLAADNGWPAVTLEDAYGTIDVITQEGRLTLPDTAATRALQQALLAPNATDPLPLALALPLWLGEREPAPSTSRPFVCGLDGEVNGRRDPSRPQRRF